MGYIEYILGIMEKRMETTIMHVSMAASCGLYSARMHAGVPKHMLACAFSFLCAGRPGSKNRHFPTSAVKQEGGYVLIHQHPPLWLRVPKD